MSLAIYSLILAPLALVIVYLYRLNKDILSLPDELKKVVHKPLSTEEIKALYEHVQTPEAACNTRVKNLPVKKGRRYVVVGCGLVGGQIVLDLLARGEPADAIRIVDMRKPIRDDVNAAFDMSSPGFVQADITSRDSVKAAFAAPWPKSVQQLPMTVFHTAAMINTRESTERFYNKIYQVNVVGTHNVLKEAKAAGCSVFIATASASISITPPKYWNPSVLFRGVIPNRVQFLDEKDAYKPLRPLGQYFGNYAKSKAEAEKIVLAADCSEMRTGTIRPANGIFGHKYDLMIAQYLRLQVVPTWMLNTVQNLVSAHNISLSQLLFEAALLTPSPKAAGKSFVITDPNPPPAFSEVFAIIAALAKTPFRVIPVPPVLLLLLAYAQEGYCVALDKYPLLKTMGLKEPTGDVAEVRPPLFAITTHTVGLDAEARKSLDEGGIALAGDVDTYEMMAWELLQWNREHDFDRKRGAEVEASLGQEVRNAIKVPVGVAEGL